jgi:hypothetical protein
MEEDDAFITTSEANDYINESVSELYDILSDGASAQIFAINAPVLTQTGTNAYLLPSDFYKLVSVSINVGGIYFPGLPGDERLYAELASDPPEQEEFRYYIRTNLSTGASHLFIFPEIDETKLAVVYIPSPPVLTLDTDALHLPTRWHEYIALSSAVKMLQKQESDTTALEFQKKLTEDRIKDHIREIDSGIPQQIRDIEYLYERTGFNLTPRRST